MIDWNKRPYVTGIELAEMGPAHVLWFTNQPNVWRNDPARDVLVNCAHPDNREWAAVDMMREAMDW